MSKLSEWVVSVAVWGVHIICSLAFIAGIFYLLTGKTRVPRYLFIISAIGFAAGLALGVVYRLPLQYVTAFGAIGLASPFILWFLCGGPCLTVKDEKQDTQTNPE